MNLGLNILVKLNEMSINAFGIFVSPYGPFEGSFYKIAFGQRPIREERKSSFLLLMKAKNTTNELTFYIMLVGYSDQAVI